MGLGLFVAGRLPRTPQFLAHRFGAPDLAPQKIADGEQAGAYDQSAQH
jgi:hypothetical protein